MLVVALMTVNLGYGSAQAQVLINEFVAANSDRLLQWQEGEGMPGVGSGARWPSLEFEDATWGQAAGPFHARAPEALPPVWTFETPANFEGWAPFGNASNMRVEQGYAEFQYIGGALNAPGLVHTGLKIHADTTSWLRLDLEVINAPEHEPVICALWWQQDAGGPNGGVGLRLFEVYPSRAFQNVWVDLKAEAGHFFDAWTGNVNLLRLEIPWQPDVDDPNYFYWEADTWNGVRTRIHQIELSASGDLSATKAFLPSQTDPAYSLYLRQTFTVSQAQAESPDPLQLLSLVYQDGFVAYLNGVEILRRTLGAPGNFVFHDQPAYQYRPVAEAETVMLSAANSLLRPGENVLAVQAHRHNTMEDIVFGASLAMGDGTLLAPSDGTWRYFLGDREPSGGLADEDGEWSDWIELHNMGANAVSLDGWALTDDPLEPSQWILPARTLAPGACLLIFASGKDRNQNTLHTNFKLASEGGFLALYDAAGTLQSGFSPDYPAQSYFHSYGRNAEGGYVYLNTPTPGTANNLTGACAAILSPPAFSTPQGFFAAPYSLGLSAEAGSEIWVTMTRPNAPAASDGQEPGPGNGMLYTVPLAIADNTIVRARAFRDGYLPSSIVTHSSIFSTGLDNPGMSEALQSLPILSVVGDEEQSLRGSNGVMAISGGDYNGPHNWWQPLTPEDYNNVLLHGRAYERPVDISLIDEPGSLAPAGFQTGAGLRIARSDATRSGFRWSDGVWLNEMHKWSFRFYFRSEYGLPVLDAPLYPESGHTGDYDTLALRTFFTDWKNPFIHEELTRRLQIEMGAGGAMGRYVNFFLNGQYKAYMNLCERLDDDYFRKAFQSDKDWDIIKMQVNAQLVPAIEVQSGDLTAFNELLSYIRSHDLYYYDNYQAVAEQMAIKQFADYLLANFYAGMVDWPNNNWIAAREHDAKGQFRFYIWDADITFGSLRYLDIDPEQQGVNNSTVSILEYKQTELGELYRALKQSPEFRLLLADRIQKHFSEGGALSKARLNAMVEELRLQLQPAISHVFGETFDPYIQETWIPNRQEALFAQFEKYGLLATLDVPAFTATPGSVHLTDPNASPDSRIVYTLDDSDPRIVGTGLPLGIEAGKDVVLPISTLTRVKARIYDPNIGAWSALVEFDAVAAPRDLSALHITEMMYHPADGGAEYIEFWNSGETALDLSGVYFDGITFVFPQGSTLEAGSYLVLAGSEADFLANYPATPLGGVYAGRLDNAGESISIYGPNAALILQIIYLDAAPWPEAPDGLGYSLEWTDQELSPSDPAAWIASPAIGGSPGRAWDVMEEGEGGGVEGESPASPPFNDDLAEARELRLDAAGHASVLGRNRNATEESGEPIHGGLGAGHSVWHTLSLPEPTRGCASREVLLTVSNADFDAVLAVYTDGENGELHAITASDSCTDESGQICLEFSHEANSETSYYIAVDSINAGETGDFQLDVLAPCPSTGKSTETPLGCANNQHVAPGGMSDLLVLLLLASALLIARQKNTRRETRG